MQGLKDILSIILAAAKAYFGTTPESGCAHLVWWACTLHVAERGLHLPLSFGVVY